jgi:two-component system sensor histidine kinase BaeS
VKALIVFPLTIAKKISLSVILILVVSVSGLAWLSARSLQSGFNDYLKEKQEQELKKVATAFGGYYRAHQSFADLRHNPRVVRPILNRALDRGEANDDDAGVNPERPRPDRGRPPPREGGRERPGPGPQAPPGMEIGPRLSLLDADGEPVFGPLRAGAQSLQAPIEVNGERVGTMIAPIPEFDLEKTTLDFVRSQIKHILFFSIAVLSIATLVSVWLGQHLVKPIAGLRRVTQQIAQGKLDARAAIDSQDELGGLASYINRMAGALESNEKKRRKIMADLSHELRTPLTVMRAEVEAVIDGVRPLNVESMQSLEAEIKHLNKLVEDLHQLALADSGDLRFQFETVDVLELLRQIAARFEARMQEMELSLKLDLPSSPLQLSADASRLTQVIENLLENSLRYTDAGGKVVMRAQGGAGMVRLTIEDSAPGLRDGGYEQLFERLHREDQARSRAKGGSGLGLSICRLLVQAHRGEISAGPSTLGGVKVEILLPVEELVRTLAVSKGEQKR